MNEISPTNGTANPRYSLSSSIGSSPIICSQCRRGSGPAGRHFGLFPSGISSLVHRHRRSGESESLLPALAVSVSSHGLSSVCSPQMFLQQRELSKSGQRQMAPPTGPDGRTLRKGNTVGEASSPRKRLSCPNRPLTNRCNKSCDWLGPGTVKTSQLNTVQLLQHDDDNLLTNPIAQVSSDILKASGYTHQFKKLLSSGARIRRESSTCARLPIGSEGMCKQQSLGVPMASSTKIFKGTFSAFGAVVVKLENS
ncbi:hypothetical protein niasHT_013556 [Heterodera trifolii]|uniref:Uncharacterized protein n=1 Tax=Heterodera trifolii TaxID=157864 RepID=A0ABD2LE38_9BILA